MSSLAIPVEERQPVDWDKVDAAIYDWLNSELALNDRMIWEQISEPQPDYPYLSLLRSVETDEGGVDENRQETLDAAGNVLLPGSMATPVENRSINYQPVQFTLTIQAHTDLDSGARVASTNAMALLSKAKRTLGKRTVIDTLQAAGVAIVEPLAVTDTSVVVNGEWLSRATLDVIFRTASVISEKVGFIDKVQLVSTELGVDIIVDAS